MVRVTPNELVEILCRDKRRGAKLCVLVTSTYPRLLKFGRESGRACPWPEGIQKIAVRPVTLGASYASAVNRMRIRDAAARRSDRARKAIEVECFKPQELWKGMGLHDTAYSMKHKGTGRRYLAYKPRQVDSDSAAGSEAINLDSQWRDARTQKTLDFDADGLAEFLPEQSKSQVQDVNHDVQWRVVALDSIVELRYGGEIYSVSHHVALAA